MSMLLFKFLGFKGLLLTTHSQFNAGDGSSLRCWCNISVPPHAVQHVQPASVLLCKAPLPAGRAEEGKLCPGDYHWWQSHSFLPIRQGEHRHTRQHLRPVNYKSQIVCVSPSRHMSMKSEQGESIGNSTNVVFGFLFKVLILDEGYLVNGILWDRGRGISFLFIAAEKMATRLDTEHFYFILKPNQTKTQRNKNKRSKNHINGANIDEVSMSLWQQPRGRMANEVPFFSHQRISKQNATQNNHTPPFCVCEEYQNVSICITSPQN